MLTRITLACIAVTASAASAQTIYEPLMTQYGAAIPSVYAPTQYPSEQVRASYTTAFETRNVRLLRLTANEVKNEANATVLRHFRKSEVAATTEVRDGLNIVTPTAPQPAPTHGYIQIRPWLPRVFPSAPILVIPRPMMNRKIGDIVGGRRV